MSDSEGRVRSSEVRQMLQSGFPDANAQNQFVGYYRDYLFPAMTQTSADALKDLGPRRNALLRDLRPPIHAEPLRVLRDLAFEEAKKIATDNYHPAARYNAMLIIGELDEKPGDSRATGAEAPVPLPAATDFFLQMLQADTAQAPDVVKLGALIGLERHALYSLPDDKRKAVTDELVELVTSARPNYRTAEAHAWLQWKAADVLTQLGELGENNRVHDALMVYLNNDQAQVVERAYVAKALERLKNKYTPQAGIDAQATVAALGSVLADVIEDEKDEAFKFNEQQRMGFQSNQFFLPGEEPPGYPKGRLLQRIGYVLDGFAAVAGALPDDLKTEVQLVVAQVEAIRTIAMDRQAVDLALTTKIEQTADQIATAADSLGQDAAEAAPATADDGLSELGQLDAAPQE